MNVPQEIRYQVIGLYIDGKSEDEMINLTGLSKAQIQNFLSNLDSPESQNILSYQIAVKCGKDGQDAKDYSELLNAKKILVQQGVLPNNTIPFVTDIAQFSRRTALGAHKLVTSFSIYHKFAWSMSIKNYQDLRKRKFQTGLSLESFMREEKALQEKYRSLTQSTVRKDKKSWE
jgi:hypothetical protein